MTGTIPLDRQVTLGEDALPGEARIINAAERALTGERRGVRAVLPFLGPAFIAAVAYVDPGNFATNMAGGSQFGYTLLWVVLAANLMAMLIQSLSAKLGIATGRSLPEVCRDRLPFRTVVLLWLQAEAVAMATDLAEFVGAALGLHLVFGLSMWVSALLTGVAAFIILGLQVWGFRRLEAAITGFVAVIVFAFVLNLLRSHPSTAGVVHGILVGKQMGIATWITFAGNNENAIVDGQIVMTQEQIQDVLRALRRAEIDITAVQRRMSDDRPDFFFVSFWGHGRASDLAHSLRLALETQLQ